MGQEKAEDTIEKSKDLNTERLLYFSHDISLCINNQSIYWIIFFNSVYLVKDD